MSFRVLDSHVGFCLLTLLLTMLYNKSVKPANEVNISLAFIKTNERGNDKMEKLNQLKIELEKKVKKIERYEKKLEQARRDYIEVVLELAEMMKRAEEEGTKKEIENLLIEDAKYYSEKEALYKRMIESTTESVVELEREIKALEAGLAQ